jgi:hypothetical protein
MALFLLGSSHLLSGGVLSGSLSNGANASAPGGASLRITYGGVSTPTCERCFPRGHGDTFVDRVNGKKKSGDSPWSLEVPPNVSLSLLAVESSPSVIEPCNSDRQIFESAFV